MAGRSRILAVLGPTNTGKTHLAIERMLARQSGMIGFPLRLLARENYDRVVRAKGASQVALITGEEKIVPPRARYFLCTIEAMPLERAVDFLAIDEVQLAADLERGHVFTDRLLHARGQEETMFLGSDIIRPLLRRLVPDAEVTSRPRLSQLSYAGHRKLSRLPPRSAVVTFSATEVYEMAELLRRQRGGAAVVLGALSPRTRNAQVELFENGDVDYMVATDAIGMGLNLGVDHVAFAKLVKFDGISPRRLQPTELAQIAGRAGRYMNDGSFGTTGSAPGLDEELVQAIEEHSFEPLTALQWRNRALDFRSPKALLRSLERRPERPELIRVRPPEDQAALAALARDEQVGERAQERDRVRLLWEVCQVPDFRKTLSEQHVRLLKTLFSHLTEGEGHLPEDWVSRQIANLDKTEGDIDALVTRIAHGRTWTFITHRGAWFDDSEHWQERARALEDKLSDALHARLTQRFVDKRTATLVRRLRDGGRLLGAVQTGGDVVVEGQHVGVLRGFTFHLDPTVGQQDRRPVLAAGRRALWEAIPGRLRSLEQDEDDAFALFEGGKLSWRGEVIARLRRGDSVLAPRIEVLHSEFLDGRARERVRLRLDAWLRRRLRDRLGPLFALREAALESPERGLAFQLSEALGLLSRRSVANALKALDKPARARLRGLGVVFGMESLYLRKIGNPEAQAMKALLWRLWHHGEPLAETLKLGALVRQPEPADADFWAALGYVVVEGADRSLAIRADRLEALARDARKLSAAGPFVASQALCRIIRGGPEDALVALPAIGYWAVEEEGTVTFHRRPRRGAKRRASLAQARGKPASGKARPARKDKSDSPFAVLRDLKFGA